MVRGRVLKTILSVVVVLVIFLIFWATVQFLVLPRSSQATQTTVSLIFIALGSISAFLAALAQISGYSFRELQRSSSRTVASGNHLSELIRAIRSDLYGNDSRLPDTLSQTLELCDRFGFDDHRVWIRKELAGFGGYQQLETEFGSGREVESWMNRWASYRLIETYFKVRFMNERGSYDIDEWPYERIFVATPLQKIIEEIQGAKSNHADELYIQLVRLDRGRLTQLRSRLAKISPGMEVPDDLQLFTRLAEYEKILFGVRDRVSELLTQASSRQPR